MRADRRNAGTLARVTTRDIRPSDAYTACDVCGRTLLRGEKADVYLNGGARRSVCELCKERALHEGWVREGTVAAYDDNDYGSDRRRSLFSRWRGRREPAPPPSASPTLADELDGHSWSEARPTYPDELDEQQPEPSYERSDERSYERSYERSRERQSERSRRAARTEADPTHRVREPRHVRAVPTNVDQKIAAAVLLFNGSEHPRTVAGVARSLGGPTVSVAESDARSSLMHIVVSWELCWYRYEVDLGEDRPSVRVADQGYELEELAPEELTPNASSDDRGALHV
jgi:hypothetical protein